MTIIGLSPMKRAHFSGGHLHTFEALSDGRTAELVWNVPLVRLEYDPSVGLNGGWEAGQVEIETVYLDGAALEPEQWAAVCPLVLPGFEDRANELTCDELTDIPGAIDELGRENDASDELEWAELAYYAEAR